MRHWFYPQHGSSTGNFRDANGELLSLFSDPDARGLRSWRETFGYERAPPPRSVKPLPVSGRATPKSSSDC